MSTARSLRRRFRAGALGLLVPVLVAGEAVGAEPADSLRAIAAYIAALKGYVPTVEAKIRIAHRGMDPQPLLAGDLLGMQQWIDFLARTISGLQGFYTRAGHAQGVAITEKLAANVDGVRQAVRTLSVSRDARTALTAAKGISDAVKALEATKAEADRCCARM